MNINMFIEQGDSGENLLELLEKNGVELKRNQVKVYDRDYFLLKIEGSGRARRAINSPRAIQNCLDPRAIAGVLGANHIYVGLSENESVIRSYQVLIFDLQVISIRLVSQSRYEKTRYLKGVENLKVSEMAKRAVFLLGLDLGLVQIDFTTRRRYRVTGINPSPVIRDKDWNRIIKGLLAMLSLEDHMNCEDIKLGADPEFMLVNSKSGKMVAASQFFPRDGTVGCDNIRVPNRQQRPVAELRPAPERSPIKLAVNIRQALNSASRMAPYRHVKWVAGSQPLAGYSIGGHIHFSNVKLNYAFLRALDNYMGIPVFLIENSATATRRRRKYGYLGDYRTKSYGGFEYRTPGSWLVSQEITLAVLCLAKIIACRYPFLGKNLLASEEAQWAFYQGDQEFFRPLFFELWSDIEKTDLYQEYKDELKVIPKMVLANAHWDEKADLRKAWKMSNSSQRQQRSSSSSEKAPASEPVQSPAASVSAPRGPSTPASGRRGRVTVSSAGPTRSSSVTRSTSRTGSIRSNSSTSGRVISGTQVRRGHQINR